MATWRNAWFARSSSHRGMRDERRRRIVQAMQFPDSTFAALNIADEPLRVGRLLLLAIVLTLAAVSAGLLVAG